MEGSSSQASERRSKANNERSSKVSFERDSIHESRFVGGKSYEEFKDICLNRNVLVERVFDEVLLREIDFRFLEDLKKWKWFDLMIRNGYVYPNCARVFSYFGEDNHFNENGENDGTKNDYEFTTLTLANRIKINGHRMNRFLGLKKRGEERISPDFDYVEAYKVVYRRPNIVAWVDEVKWLDVHCRILPL